MKKTTSSLPSESLVKEIIDLQNELDYRTEIEDFAIELIKCLYFQEALDILSLLDLDYKVSRQEMYENLIGQKSSDTYTSSKQIIRYANDKLLLLKKASNVETPVLPIVVNAPVFSRIFKNMFVGYEKRLWCTYCNSPICNENQDVPIRCPNCLKELACEGSGKISDLHQDLFITDEMLIKKKSDLQASLDYLIKTLQKITKVTSHFLCGLI